MTFPSRRGFVAGIIGVPAISSLVGETEEKNSHDAVRRSDDSADITEETVVEASKLLNLDFTAAERAQLLPSLRENLAQIQAIRGMNPVNSLMPATVFQAPPPTFKIQRPAGSVSVIPEGEPQSPEDDDDLAFRPITDLARLLRTKKLSSERLTQLAIRRLKEHDPALRCVVTLLEDRALAEARVRGEELKRGVDRGPLHGIPYGLKDLFAVKGAPTTFGAKPFKDQILDTESAVSERLRDAGAVLCAKLSLGALAMGDLWFGGRTKNPWNLRQGSSGSSAGSASSVAAGLLSFAIGTETLGSIVSPCTRCGVSGLRPTLGRISRRGSMSLCPSMDKVGPIARTVRDLALIFDALRERAVDPADPATAVHGFSCVVRADLKGYRIGYVPSEFEGDRRENDRKVLDTLRNLGAELLMVAWPHTTAAPLRMILSVEAAASFEQITRDGSVRELDGQERNDWPNLFRSARFVPAVEFHNAQRLRRRLVEEMSAITSEVDAIVTPSFAGGSLLPTNLTGHPACVIPTRLSERSNESITFVGSTFNEGALLEIAALVQETMDIHRERPRLR